MKLFRRTWEKQATGRAGVVSNVVNAKSGTANIGTATFAAPINFITIVTGSITSGDVGRKIWLEGTPSNDRYGDYYIVHAVSGSNVTLRLNHNTGAVSNSFAQFMETSTGGAITWTIPEGCQFTADVAGDFVQTMSGSYITIQGAINADNNNTQWEISHWIDNQNVLLNKSYIYYPVDYVTTTVFKKTDFLPFVAETGLRYFVADREAVSAFDMFRMVEQFMHDSGHVLLQMRGRDNSGRYSIHDNVWSSIGEPDATIPQNKKFYVRFCYSMFQRNGVGSGNIPMGYYTLHQHWDPTLTNGLPGNGIAGLPGDSARNSAGANFNLLTGNNAMWNLYGGDLYSQGGNGLPLDLYKYDYSLFGDLDEVRFFVHAGAQLGTGVSANGPQWVLSAGWMQRLGSNPNILTVTAPVTPGTNVSVNVGAVDPTTLTPPYAIGDNICIAGFKTSSPTTTPVSATQAEFLETQTIVGFDKSDMANIKIQLGVVTGSYGNGPDTLKAVIGEDVMPLFVDANNGARWANAARLGDSVGRDYQTSPPGIDVDPFQAFGLGEVDPNRMTGKFSLSAIMERWIGWGEFRGRRRYDWRGSARITKNGKYVSRTGEVYVTVTGLSGSDSLVVGPMTKTLAAVFD